MSKGHWVDTHFPSRRLLCICHCQHSLFFVFVHRHNQMWLSNRKKKKEEKSAALLLEGWRKVCRSCSTITVYATWPYIHQAVCVLCNVTYLRTMGEFVTMWQENHKSRLLIKYCSTRLVPLHGSRSGLQTTQRIATPSQTTLTFCWYAHFKSKPNATV